MAICNMEIKEKEKFKVAMDGTTKDLDVIDAYTRFEHTIGVPQLLRFANVPLRDWKYFFESDQHFVNPFHQTGGDITASSIGP